MLLLRRARTSTLSRDAARRFLSSYLDKRALKAKDLAALAEVRQAAIFTDQLSAGACERYAAPGHGSCDGVASPALLDVASVFEVRAALQAGMATFALHAEARVASALGAGFYTIGPCGEELLAAVGLVLRPDDSAALHYRHLATQVARHARPLVARGGLDGTFGADPLASQAALAKLFLDRARGYVASSFDPVTGGAHCALGGGRHDFVVTSTLASQASPAVGRALAPGLMAALGLGRHCLTPPKGLSYCSLGDGSVNNAHFLAAANLATYLEHRRVRCPVLFGVSDNGLCISLKGHGWLPVFLQQLGMPVFTADGCSLASVFSATRRAADFVRRRGKPAVVVFAGLPRRFGHAATDRQAAYLAAAEVDAHERTNPLGFACADAVASGAATYPELARLWAQSQAMALGAFAQAAAEPKLGQLGLANLLQRNHAPFLASRATRPVAAEPASTGAAAGAAAAGASGGVRRSSLASVAELQALAAAEGNASSAIHGAPLKDLSGGARRNVMRKHMTACLAESFEKYARARTHLHSTIPDLPVSYSRVRVGIFPFPNTTKLPPLMPLGCSRIFF
jgi:2-oxoisovalerate dehydrogenase E1 component